MVPTIGTKSNPADKNSSQGGPAARKPSSSTKAIGLLCANEYGEKSGLSSSSGSVLKNLPKRPS